LTVLGVFVERFWSTDDWLFSIVFQILPIKVSQELQVEAQPAQGPLDEGVPAFRGQGDGVRTCWLDFILIFFWFHGDPDRVG
jgi:hypothetical protein